MTGTLRADLRPNAALECQSLKLNLLSDGFSVSEEGVGAAEQVVHDYPQTPNVHLVVISEPCPYLRRHVDRSTAVRSQHLV